jgi:hypothetical protein
MTDSRRRVVSQVTSGAEPLNDQQRIARRRESLDEQARRRGIRPINDVSEMARDDVFESDEQLDAFITFVYAERQANLT